MYVFGYIQQRNVGMQPMQMRLHADMQQINRQQLNVDAHHKREKDEKHQRSKTQQGPRIAQTAARKPVVPRIFDAAPYRQTAKAYCMQGCACVCMPESVCPYHFLAYNFTAKVESAIGF